MAATETKNVVSQLNHLIETCRDGEEGFRLAADTVEEDTLRALFRSYSAQRGDFAAQLQREVVQFGEVPETDGSLMGSMHRGWMNIKTAVVGDDTTAIVSECERGEDSAIEAYQSALESDLPPRVRAVLAQQYAAVQEAHDRVRALEVARSGA